MITKQELGKVKYGPALESKLKELGVGQYWVPGGKKSDIIDKAFKHLQLVKKFEGEGLEDREEIDKEIEKLLSNLEDVKENQASKEEVVPKESPKPTSKEKKITLEQLKKAKVIAEANLSVGFIPHRLTLLKKIEELDKRIKEYKE